MSGGGDDTTQALATSAALADWFAAQLGVDRVTIEDFAGVPVGHSAETIALTVVYDEGTGSRREEVVLRVRPRPPSLLEPYDLRKQFEILRALEPTPVRAPSVLWYEETGDVLGREFLVMRRAPGTVYEREIPEELLNDAPRVRRMSEELVDELAAIHSVPASSFPFLGAGDDFLQSQVAYWSGEMRRIQRGPLPALEQLLAALEARMPAPSSQITLVHGDAKPGNFAFVRDRLTASFDWEMTTLGDPMADVAYAQVTWQLPGTFTRPPASLTIDEFADRYERLTGFATHDLDWHRAFQGYKLGVIMLLGSWLFDAGHTDDPRMAYMGGAMSIFTAPAFADLGLDDVAEQGAVLPRPERLALLSSGK
ncbi:MAG: phosphotransferase family protein [Acidimicrobiia bacterium]